MSGSGESRLDLEVPAARRERPLGGDPPAGHEEGPRVPWLCRRHDETPLERPEPREPVELAADALQRVDAVTQPCGVLVAAGVRQLRQPPSQPRQRRRRPLQLVRDERPRGELGLTPGADRSHGRGLRRRHHAVPAPAQPDVAVGPCHSRVRGRPQLADQPKLLQRGLELGAEHPPLDSLGRRDGRLHRRPLALRAEVRAESRAQVAGATDVEHLAVPVVEQIDTGSRRRAEREVPTVPDPARPRRAERDEVGDGAGAPLLGEADQREQHLGRRQRVRKRAVARLSRRAEEVRELGEARARHASREQPTGERNRVHYRSCDPRPGQPLGLPVEERQVEPRVVRDEHRVAAGELQKPAHRESRRRSGPQLPVPEPGQRRRRGGHGHPRIDERLELLGELEPADAHRTDLADLGGAWPEPCRLEINDDVRRVLQRHAVAWWPREGDRVAVPRQPRVGFDHLREQRARERDGRLPQREQTPRRLVRDDGAAALLDKLHETVGGI